LLKSFGGTRINPKTDSLPISNTYSEENKNLPLKKKLLNKKTLIKMIQNGKKRI
jgi:hypothetical protein